MQAGWYLLFVPLVPAAGRTAAIVVYAAVAACTLGLNFWTALVDPEDPWVKRTARFCFPSFPLPPPLRPGPQQHSGKGTHAMFAAACSRQRRTSMATASCIAHTAKNRSVSTPLTPLLAALSTV